MVIYGDILFIVNMTIDYLIISLTGVFLKRRARILRQLIAAFIGGISAFYIFIETNSFLIDVLFRIIVSLIMSLVAFSFQNFRKLARAVFVNLTLSLLLSGIADLLISLFKSRSVTVKNTVLYLDISPILLILVSVLFYLIMRLIFNLKKNSVVGEICNVRIVFGDSEANFGGLIDSGNSISDAMSDSEVFIVSKKVVEALLKSDMETFFRIEENKSRCRVIPITTVAGSVLLKAVRCDSADIRGKGISVRLIKPIIAESSENFNDEYEIIVPMGALKGR